MISEQEANLLINEFISLKKMFDKTNDLKIKKNLDRCERVCIEKFKYIVISKANNYKKYHNYEDLIQEGLLALARAMKTFTPGKGSWFWWAHKYIDTKIARCARLHSVIKVPLKKAKGQPPIRENKIPLMVEKKYIPELEVEEKEISVMLLNAIDKLNKEEGEVVGMMYGFSGEGQMSLRGICRKKNISREKCLTLLDRAMEALRVEVKI